MPEFAPACLRWKYAAASPLMPPPTTTRSYFSPVSIGFVMLYVWSRTACAVSKEPGWLPRIPVKAGG